MGENKELKSQYEEMRTRAINAETENKTLIDRWMLQKMQDAERLNEVYALLLVSLLLNLLQIIHFYIYIYIYIFRRMLYMKTC